MPLLHSYYHHFIVIIYSQIIKQTYVDVTNVTSREKNIFLIHGTNTACVQQTRARKRNNVFETAQDTSIIVRLSPLCEG